MRRSFAIGLVSLVGVGWCVSQFGGDTSKQPPSSAPVAPAAKAPPDLTLKGITSGDLRVQLSKRGLQCEGPRREISRVSWVCTSGDYRVEFFGKSPTRIDYVTGTAMQVSRSAATQFLSYIASLPYEGSAPEQAQKWVESQRSPYAETTIGGVKVRLSGPAAAPSISLFPVGSEWDR